MPAQLVALTDGPSILLDKPILLLGRHAECDIQLNSRKVSRRHCCIAQVNDYLVVRDLGSTNGIRVNGIRVLEGKLNPDDELTVGNFRYRVTWDDKPVGRGKPTADRVAKIAPPPPRKQPARAKAQTDPDEDALLESCDEPVPLGKPAMKPKPPTKAIDPSPMFPDNVNLRDSKADV